MLVLPELAFTEALVESARAELARAKGSLKLVVMGSVHVDGAIRANLSTVLYGNGELAWSHHKFSPFVLPDGFREDLRFSTDRPITIRAAGDWLVTSLICKDLIHSGVDELLGELGVNLVLVPSLTEKLDPLRQSGEHLVQRSQAFSLIANACVAWPSAGRIGALVVGPSRTNPVLRTPILSGPVNLWIVELGRAWGAGKLVEIA